jgi:hypothetical protein
MSPKPCSWAGCTFSGLILLALALVLNACQSVPAVTQPATITPPIISSQTPTSTLLPSLSPTPDPLAEPPLPANPTQLENGRHLYWLNCMPCHGDRGQGLTAEFRQVYVEDANCWARGCHGGRLEDKGFPIPKTVPAIISSTGTLPPFDTPEKLYQFLRATHPPQNPGFMPDSDYWALTAYLWDQNGRLAPGTILGP